MAERRSLVEGLKQAKSPVDPHVAHEFIYGSKPTSSGEGPTNTIVAPSSRPSPCSPISTRIRTDLVAALKRASLERQLSGTEPSTLKNILEEAIEPWLKSNGYLP